MRYGIVYGVLPSSGPAFEGTTMLLIRVAIWPKIAATFKAKHADTQPRLFNSF